MLNKRVFLCSENGLILSDELLEDVVRIRKERDETRFDCPHGREAGRVLGEGGSW